jgi:hypothetical protein
MVGIVVTWAKRASTHSTPAMQKTKTYNFTKLQLVQNGGLAGCVEPNHQNSHFLFGKETLEQALEGSHLDESGSSGCFFSRECTKSKFGHFQSRLGDRSRIGPLRV